MSGVNRLSVYYPLPLSFSPSLSVSLPLSWGGGASKWLAPLVVGGALLAGRGDQLVHYYWHLDQISAWLKDFIDALGMPGRVLSVMRIFLNLASVHFHSLDVQPECQEQFQLYLDVEVTWIPIWKWCKYMWLLLQIIYDYTAPRL